MDFKENGFMYGIAVMVIVFVLAQAFFFLIRAWRRGKEIGMSTSTLKNVVTSSALFTIAPAIAAKSTNVSAKNAILTFFRHAGRRTIIIFIPKSPAIITAVQITGTVIASPISFIIYILSLTAPKFNRFYNYFLKDTCIFSRFKVCYTV